jgi:hypothetical protein
MTILLILVAIPPALLAAAFFYARLVNTPSRTISESIIRWMCLLERWIGALARSADSAVVCYREHVATERISICAERFRPWQIEPPVSIAMETTRRWEA